MNRDETDWNETTRWVLRFEPATSRAVSALSAPDLIGPLDCETAQEIWKHPMRLMGPARVRLRIQGVYAHDLTPEVWTILK